MTEAQQKADFQRVLREHAVLKGQIGTIRGFLDVPRPEVGKVGAHTWAADLLRQLVDLHDHLFRHFRMEEQSGALDELGDRRPERAREVRSLIDEHAGMLECLKELIVSTTEYSEGHRPRDPALRSRLVGLLDWLVEHEESENELIQGAFYRDLGTGD